MRLELRPIGGMMNCELCFVASDERRVQIARVTRGYRSFSGYGGHKEEVFSASAELWSHQGALFVLITEGREGPGGASQKRRWLTSPDRGETWLEADLAEPPKGAVRECSTEDRDH